MAERSFIHAHGGRDKQLVDLAKILPTADGWIQLIERVCLQVQIRWSGAGSNRMRSSTQTRTTYDRGNEFLHLRHSLRQAYV